MPGHTYHFVPADRPEMLNKTLPAPPAAVIYDLEDAVSPDRKILARDLLERHFAGDTHRRQDAFVRINASDSADYDADLALVSRFPGVGVVLPKVERQEQVDSLIGPLPPESPIIILIESFSGLGCFPKLTLEKRIVGAGLGMEDLLSVCPRFYNANGAFQRHIKLQFTLSARAHGVSPIHGISLEVRDLNKVHAACASAVELGFDGMFSIHPAQIRQIDEVFSSTSDEIAWAQHVVETAESAGYHGGYMRVGEAVLSPPKLKKAHRILSYNQDHYR